MFVQIAVPPWVRPHLIPPARETVTIGSTTLDGISLRGDGPGAVSTITAHTADPGRLGAGQPDHRPVRAGDRRAALLVRAVPAAAAVPGRAGRGRRREGQSLTCFDRLSAEGYRQQLVYQPASRFWALQWAETGLFLAAVRAAGLVLLWWVRRRLT